MFDVTHTIFSHCFLMFCFVFQLMNFLVNEIWTSGKKVALSDNFDLCMNLESPELSRQACTGITSFYRVYITEFFPFVSQNFKVQRHIFLYKFQFNTLITLNLIGNSLLYKLRKNAVITYIVGQKQKFFYNDPVKYKQNKMLVRNKNSFPYYQTNQLVTFPIISYFK